MGKEIKEQVSALQEMEEREIDKRTARELRELLKEWKEQFRNDNDNGNKNLFEQQTNETKMINEDDNNFLSPLEVKEEMNQLRHKVIELKHKLDMTQYMAENTKRSLETELDNNAEAFRLSAQADRDRQKKTLEEIKQNYENETECAREKVIQAKKDAEKVIQVMRQNAEDSISEVISNLSGEKKRIKQQLQEERMKLHEEYESKIEELNFRIENKDRLHREGVSKECKRLKHHHAIELAEARKEGILKGCKAAFGEVPSKIKCCACANNRSKQKEKHEMKKCICGAYEILKSSHFYPCQANLHPLQADECQTLKRQIHHLEDIVQNLVGIIKEGEERKYNFCCEKLGCLI